MGRLLYDESNLPEINTLKAANYDIIDKNTVEPVKRVGVLTSGGDAPGMNACIRSVVRAGLNAGFEMYGVTRGFHGLWKGEIKQLDGRSVSETLQRGGTFLMTARSQTLTTLSITTTSNPRPLNTRIAALRSTSFFPRMTRLYLQALSLFSVRQPIISAR